MVKCLVQGTYTLQGVRGLIEEGGTSRKAHFEENVKNLDGTVEAFYYAFGTNDLYSIVELPDNVSSAALSLAINAGGGFQGNVIVLLSPEEIDLAKSKTVSVGYRAPGE